jgi:hypothetical protein
MRSVIGISVLVFSTLFGFVPDLWHAGMFSASGILLSGVGGVFGVWFGVRVSHNLGI